MSYTALMTYSVYDLNSSEFMKLIQEVLIAEFTKQRSTFENSFLPKTVKLDSYLLNPISDKEIDPAFCSIIKSSMANTDMRFVNQQNNANSYTIGILANGLTNLRKIGDAIYEILNDMDVKNYLFLYQNSNGETLISDSSNFYISTLAIDFEVSKNMNDKDVVYGNLVLNAEIAEVPKFNTYETLNEITTEHQLGDDKTELTQTEKYTEDE